MTTPLPKWTINLAEPGKDPVVTRDGQQLDHVTSVLVFQKTGEAPTVVVSQLAGEVAITGEAKRRKPAPTKKNG